MTARRDARSRVDVRVKFDIETARWLAACFTGMDADACHWTHSQTRKADVDKAAAAHRMSHRRADRAARRPFETRDESGGVYVDAIVVGFCTVAMIVVGVVLTLGYYGRLG